MDFICRLLVQFSKVYKKITSIDLGINSLFVCGSLILTQVVNSDDTIIVFIAWPILDWNFFVIYFFLSCHIQKAIATSNYSSSYKFFNIIWVFTTWLYLVCSFGDQVTNRLIEISDMIFGCAWYQYPIDVRKSQLMMMMSAQRPIFIEGFPNYKCTLDTFKKVQWRSFHFESACALGDGCDIHFIGIFQVMNFCYSVFMLMQRADFWTIVGWWKKKEICWTSQYIFVYYLFSFGLDFLRFGQRRLASRWWSKWPTGDFLQWICNMHLNSLPFFFFE